MSSLAVADQCHGESAQRSVDGGRATSIKFTNRRARNVDVYWINYQGRRQRYATIQPGQTWSAKTYLTHPWVVVETSTGACIGVFLPLPNGQVITLN